MHAHKGGISFVQQGSVDGVVGIGPVEHDEFHTGFCAGFHQVVQGAQVSIKTGSYILNIKNNQIEFLHQFRTWLFLLAIERIDC